MPMFLQALGYARLSSSIALHPSFQSPDTWHTLASFPLRSTKYTANTNAKLAAKFAQRALADTLRVEATRYSGPVSTYSVQCIFAHNYITPTFIEEQKNKPDLTKRLEGTTGNLDEIEKNFPYAAKIAPEIVEAVRKGDYAVMDNRFEPQFCWAVSMGSAPKRGWGIWDTILAIIASLVFPFVRSGFEKESRGDALREE